MVKNFASPEAMADDPLQQALYQSSQVWVEAIAARNGLEGRLTMLPNDPVTYPYQRWDVNLLKSYRPSQEAIEAEGLESIQERVLARLVAAVEIAIDPKRFTEFSSDLRLKALPPKHGLVKTDEIYSPPPGSALQTVAAGLGAKGNNVKIVGFHPKIVALPVYGAAFIAGIKNNHDEQNQGPDTKPFDLFGLTEQIIMPINKSLVFAEYYGVPLAEFLSTFCTIELNIPTTASSRLVGIGNNLRKMVNDLSNEQSREYREYLNYQGKSFVVIEDPTGSTAERLENEAGNLSGLRFRRLSPTIASSFEDFKLAWPITMWWDTNPEEAVWHIGDPQSIIHSDDVTRLIRNLAAETGKLAGVPVYFGRDETAYGQTAISSVRPEQVE